jgi:hypothetical protein
MWYRTGTITLTQGSKVVTGDLTNWITQQSGWILFSEQSASIYEIDKIVSSTEATLVEPFDGTTAAELSYAIIPTMSLNVDLAIKINAMLRSFTESRDYWAAVIDDFNQSTYALWLDQGNEGTIDDFLAYLIGPVGDSSYETWLELGNTGSKQNFLDEISDDIAALVAADAQAAASSETAAASSETAAANSETAAANSETAAASSETAAASSETATGISETNASASETAAGISETNASASETAAAGSETASGASETAAGASETNASASETASAASEALAQQWSDETEDIEVTTGLYSAKHHAFKAAASALAASTDLSDIEAIETSLKLVFDNFDDRMLGSFTTANEPTTDNDGNAILIGAMYYNEDVLDLYFWAGSEWKAPAPAAEAAAAAALASQNAAGTSEINAADSEDAAKISETAAGTSETNAAASETAAGISETNASASETAAGASETAAGTSEVNSKASEDAAKLSENAAAASETAAANSEAAAGTSETNAANSETAAGTSEVNSKASEDAAKLSETNASASETAAASSETNASASETAAASSETNASASETAAASSETNAGFSEDAAKLSEDAAKLSETNAASSETVASTAATTATDAEVGAVAARDDLFSRYIGRFADDTAATNSGYTIEQGLFYWSTGSSGLRVYTGTNWASAVLDANGALMASNNLSEVNPGLSRGNLGLGTAAITDATAYATAAQGTTADSALQSSDIGSAIQAFDAILDATTASFLTAEKSKLTDIEDNADVTDATNVAAAGALMDNEVANLTQIKTFNAADYATAAQGATADSALQSSDIGAAVQAFDAVLDATTASFLTAEKSKLTDIEDNADVTDAVTVAAAGALMDNEVANLTQIKTFNAADYATAAQGATADSALQSSDVGTAAALDAATSGDATAGQVVTGDDSRLKTGQELSSLAAAIVFA